MHLGLSRQLPEHVERLAVGGVLAAQLLDAPLHRCVEVVPPGLLRQGEMAEQRESARGDDRQDIGCPAHPRIVLLEARLDLGGGILLAPDSVGEGQVSAGAQQSAAHPQGIPDADIVERTFGPD